MKFRPLLGDTRAFIPHKENRRRRVNSTRIFAYSTNASQRDKKAFILENPLRSSNYV